MNDVLAGSVLTLRTNVEQCPHCRLGHPNRQVVRVTQAADFPFTRYWVCPVTNKRVMLQTRTPNTGERR